MIRKNLKNFKALFKNKKIDESAHYLLSQELEFEYAKSIVTYSIAFIGGIVTLYSALSIERPIEDGLSTAIIAAILSAVLAFENQQGIIKDLYLKRSASPFQTIYRKFAAPMCLGIALGNALMYFGVLV